MAVAVAGSHFDIGVDELSSFVVIDSTRLLVSARPGKPNSIITYTLPPVYFDMPKCCDRDL